VTCAVGDLLPEESATVTMVVKVTARGGTTLSNTATASSTTPDPDTANNTASITTGVFGSRK
jgi:hypothetical protein